MNDLWAQVFHHLPPQARTVVASLRGRYLAAWRYGSQTERLVAEALDRDQWSTERWQAYQDERLAIILRRASQTVPYYRDQWAARRRAGDRASTDYLENWPILEKESLRANPTAFVAADCNRRWMFHEQTSGTSGTCLDLWRSRDTVQAVVRAIRGAMPAMVRPLA